MELNPSEGLTSDKDQVNNFAPPISTSFDVVSQISTLVTISEGEIRRAVKCSKTRFQACKCQQMNDLHCVLACDF
jgi:hypothetical protein